MVDGFMDGKCRAVAAGELWPRRYTGKGRANFRKRWFMERSDLKELEPRDDVAGKVFPGDGKDDDAGDFRDPGGDAVLLEQCKTIIGIMGDVRNIWDRGVSPAADPGGLEPESLVRELLDKWEAMLERICGMEARSLLGAAAKNRVIAACMSEPKEGWGNQIWGLVRSLSEDIERLVFVEDGFVPARFETGAFRTRCVE